MEISGFNDTVDLAAVGCDDVVPAERHPPDSTWRHN
jgi:hypothetical protein